MSKKILVVFHLNFLRNDRGCTSYIYNIVKYLKSKGFSIDFLSNNPDNDFEDFDELNQKEKLIDNLFLFNSNDIKPQKKYFGLIKTRYKYKKGKRYIKTYFCGVGISLKPDEKYYSTWVNDEFVEFYNNVVNSNHYDYINIHYIQFADLLKYGQTPSNTTTIYSMHDANYLQEFYCDSENKFNKNPIEKEILQVSLFDKIMSISVDEKQFFEKLLPDKKFYFLPPIVDKQNTNKKITKDINILFLGHQNPYNYEGIVWFLEKVYPLLKHKNNIWIAGKVINMLIQDGRFTPEKLAEAGINTIEFAQDLDELYARTKISIVPMFRGTGMKIKTIDAMSRGIPVVSTYLGVDGFPDKNKNGCLVTDKPEEFAANIDKLLDDKIYYEKVQNEINDYFKNYLSIEKTSKVLDECFEA